MSQLVLPPGFEFSQSSLQDYVDCKRRFQLKVLQDQPWPALEVEPVLERERHVERGQRFHRLLERYYSGVPVEVLTASIHEDDKEIARWWQAFLAEPPLSLPESLRVPEVRLSMPFAGNRLVAVFDMVAVDPGRRLVIVDWKTRRRLSSEWIEGRLQSIIYPFLAVEAGEQLFGEAVDPARVSMVFWFALEPENPYVIHYDAEKHEINRGYLESLFAELLSRDAGQVWPLVVDDARCRYCQYRSLCDRGVGPVAVDDLWLGFDQLGFDDLVVVDEVSY